MFFADEPIDRVDAKDLEGVSQDEAECVLEIDPIDEEPESTSTARRGRATVRSSQPQWVKGSASDHTKIPDFEPNYELDETVKQPIEYFKSFVTEEILQLLVDQSNLYATQKTVNKPLDVSVNELERWLGLTIHFSLSKLPSCRMHWDASLGVATWRICCKLHVER